MAEYIGKEKALAFPFANGNYDRKNANADFIRGCESYREYLESIPVADVIPQSETCPYFVHNENDRGNDSLCGKAGCEVEFVRPASYGTWINHQIGNWIYAKCSECGTVHDVRSNFCPHCGAKMDLGVITDD